MIKENCPRALTLNLDMLARLNATRVWSYTISVEELEADERWNGSKANCLGAVVLTWIQGVSASKTSRRQRWYLEGHGIGVLVVQTQDLGDLVSERAW